MEMSSSAVCSSHPVLQRRCCLHSRLPRNRLTQLHCRAQAQSGSKERKYSIAEKVLIAGLGLSLTLGPLQVDQAQASIEDDNQQAQQALSFYQQRKAEAQRRKDLLAQRREKELEKGGTETPSAPAAQDNAFQKQLSDRISSFQTQVAPAPAAPSPAIAAPRPAPAAAPSLPEEPAVNWWESVTDAAKDAAKDVKESVKESVPAPAPVFQAKKATPPPPPPPAPVKAVKAPEAAPKVAPKPKDDGKRHGPLPLFLAQLLVLAAYVGIGYVAIIKPPAVLSLLRQGWTAGEAALKQLDGLLTPKKS